MQQRVQRHAKISLPVAAIDQDTNTDNLRLKGSQCCQHFADGSACCKHVIDDQNVLARVHLKATPQGALAGTIWVVFDKDAAHPKLARYFICKDDAASRGANHNFDIGGTKVVSQGPAEAFGVLGPLQHLELFPIGGAVAARGEEEMAFQHCPRLAEDVLDCLFV